MCGEVQCCGWVGVFAHSLVELQTNPYTSNFVYNQTPDRPTSGQLLVIMIFYIVFYIVASCAYRSRVIHRSEYVVSIDIVYFLYMGVAPSRNGLVLMRIFCGLSPTQESRFLWRERRGIGGNQQSTVRDPPHPPQECRDFGIFGCRS